MVYPETVLNVVANGRRGSPATRRKCRFERTSSKRYLRKQSFQRLLLHAFRGANRSVAFNPRRRGMVFGLA
jgi:hypothetical protein